MQNKAPFTETEQNSIRDTASRILDHPSFRSSERSTRLFRYLLERSLIGEGETLKERHVGHEVFGREISYDTASDPVVRNAASETRKRLKQFDAESGANEQVRVLLKAGTYVLDFQFISGQGQKVEPAERGLDPGSVVPSIPGQVNPPVWRKLTFAYSVAVAALLGCALLGFELQRNRERQIAAVDASSSDPLWAPMFSYGKEIFISLGHAENIAASDTQVTLTSGGLQRVTVTDLRANTNISGFLQLNRRPFEMRTDTATTLLDLKDRPVVLIGIHNNGWTLRLTHNIRYRFDFEEFDPAKPSSVVTIVDSQHPERRLWQVPLRHGVQPLVDYAVAGRFLDPVTGGLVLYVAGAGPVGTQAASEFVTQPRFLRSLPESVRNPRTKFEVVLKTQIVDGVPGFPEVLETDIQ